MASFADLLRTNPNYRRMWLGQIVSEIGDHFNNIAVFSLAMENSRSGLVVMGVMLARAIPAVLAGPFAGVLLDRLDRRKVMIASDLVRFFVALGFIVAVDRSDHWPLYVLSGLLMFASPFFTSGRSAIMPTITTPQELHTANAITQTTQWTTLTLGTFSAGLSVHQLGYKGAFFLNALSFLFSAWSIYRMRIPVAKGAAPHSDEEEGPSIQPWNDYVEGLRYLRKSPLMLAIALAGVGWASGGGAAQILFSLFGELVFKKGAAGIGIIWGCAGIGLIIGGTLAHRIGRYLTFQQYSRLVLVCYLLHGVTYVIFSQMREFWLALVFIGLSRLTIAISSVLNWGMLLDHVANEYRGRVFTTMETIVWSTMMVSMMIAGIASQNTDPRVIGAWAGAFSMTTAVYWWWAMRKGLIAEPETPSRHSEEEYGHRPVESRG
ncbi:MAG: MFS transporter [Bryobacteraceae bacterium]